MVENQVTEKGKVPKPLQFQDFSGAASQIRTGYRVPWGTAPWEPSDLAIEKADEVASYAEINKNPLR